MHATTLVAGIVMAVLKGWEEARHCQTVDGRTLKELALTQGILSIKDERNRMKC